MYKRFIIIFSAILMAGSLFGLSGKNENRSIDIFPGNIMNWNMKGTPDVYKGDDLFLYINGGADIYQEYGFKEVYSVEYEKEGAGRISVEIYHMDSPTSAFGIFSFKTGGKWKESKNGNLYFPEEYYQNILADNYLITITSIDINEKTERAIRIFRKTIEKKISGNSLIPGIIDLFDKGKFEKRIYFEGDLGLMNIYNLVSAESGMVNGAAGINNGNITFILNYNEGENVRSKYSSLIDLLKTESRYSEFAVIDNGVSFLDRKKNVIYVSILNRYIVVFIGKKLNEGKMFFKYISDKISIVK